MLAKTIKNAPILVAHHFSWFLQLMNVEINYPPKLKAISIHAPHAYAICLGVKEAEYRSQPTTRRGWVLIHASQSKQSDDYFADYGIDPATVKRGAIIGAVKITNLPAGWTPPKYHLGQ